MTLTIQKGLQGGGEEKTFWRKALAFPMIRRRRELHLLGKIVDQKPGGSLEREEALYETLKKERRKIKPERAPRMVGGYGGIDYTRDAPQALSR